MDEKKCCICDEDINGIYEDLFVNHTKHSRALLYDVVQKIVKRDFVKPDQNLLCYSCINRINKYEFGILLAEQMEKEILESLANTENKYQFVSIYKYENEEEEEECLDIKPNIDDNIASPGYIELVQEWKEEEDQISHSVQYDVYEMDDSQNESSLKDLNEEDNDQFVIETVPIDIKPFKVTNKPKRRWNCEKCDISFTSLAECKQHKESKHNEATTPLQCHICGVGFETRSRLNNHMRSHQDPIKCDICNKEFTQKGALKRHMAIHTGEKPYQCDICGKQFVHGSSFHMHNLAHGNIREETCQICGYKLRSRSHLKRHMLIHTGEKKHECPKCGQKFAQRYNMNVHLKLHEGIKRQKPATKHFCLVCDLKFKTLKALNEHNEQYHDVDDFNEDDKNLAQLEHFIEDQTDMYDSNSLIDAYSNENVKVQLLL